MIQQNLPWKSVFDSAYQDKKQGGLGRADLGREEMFWDLLRSLLSCPGCSKHSLGRRTAQDGAWCTQGWWEVALDGTQGPSNPNHSGILWCQAGRWVHTHWISPKWAALSSSSDSMSQIHPESPWTVTDPPNAPSSGALCSEGLSQPWEGDTGLCGDRNTLVRAELIETIEVFTHISSQVGQERTESPQEMFLSCFPALRAASRVGAGFGNASSMLLNSSWTFL